MGAEFDARLAGLVAASDAAKRSGGPWRLYTPLPGSAELSLFWSYPTREAAEAALAPMFPGVRKLAVIRHEEG